MNLIQKADRVHPIVLIMLFALLIAMPSVVNGKPFIFYDSTHYYDIGKAIFLQAEDILIPSGDVDINADRAETNGSEEFSDDGGIVAISAGRSPVYSILIYVVSSIFSAYGMVALQSTATAFVVYRFLKVIAPALSAASQLALMATLAAFTPLGFHAGFVMPDIFAAIYVLAALVLILDHALSRREAIVLTALLAFAATMHSTILLLGLVLLGLVAASRFSRSLRSVVEMRAAIWITISLILCMAFNSAYKSGVELVTGEKVRSAPYLMARVMADGPGKRLLAEHCNMTPYAACRFQNVPYIDHNDFLWGENGSTLNFSSVDPATKTALQDEEMDFVRAAISAYPLQQLGASINNAFDQFILTGISEIKFGADNIVQSPDFAGHELMQHLPGLDDCADANRCTIAENYRDAWNALVYVCTLLALVALIAAAAHSLLKIRFRIATLEIGLQRILVATCFLFVILLANAAICGVLSGPHDRYQARLTWIAALILGAGFLYLKKSGKHEEPA